MNKNIALGAEGEKIACDCMIKKGYEIVARNYRHKSLEIDIIAENKDFVVFVEVKTRSGYLHEMPEQAVKYKKQSHILSAADFYMRRRNIDKEARFDIISIFSHDSNWKLKHIENAFFSGR
jgi:putative endonuclease